MVETSPAIRPGKPWALTFFGLLAVAGLIAMPYLAGPPDAEKLPDIIRFIGHFHPVLLHLPIGVFLLIMLQELAAIFGRRHHEQVANTAMFPLFFGVISAIAAVLAGFLLFQGGEEYAGNALVERHLWGGLIFAVAAVLTFILKAWTVALAGNPAFYRMMLFISVAVMGIASHDGGSITHGEPYLTEYAPNPLRSLLGLEKKSVAGPKKAAAADRKSDEKLVYADIIAPILERRCVQCHKDGKAKGKLRMDTFEMLVKGGKDGPAIKPGSADKSLIVERIELPKDDDDHMPPEGKPEMEAHEIAVLKWWIDNGADTKKSLKESEVPAPIKEAIAKLAPAATDSGHGSAPASESSPEGNPTNSGPDTTLQASVKGLSKEFPGALTFESQDSSGLTFTAVSLRGNFDDAGFHKLEKVLSHLVTVDLSATKITDLSVAMLASADQLRVVRLAETGITDASIDSLLKLPALESLNLYGTKVTDAGVSKLASLPNLKRLYLWQTAVTPEAVKALREKLPGCEIITGA
jgi:uncharacterized membrane protein